MADANKWYAGACTCHDSLIAAICKLGLCQLITNHSPWFTIYMMLVVDTLACSMQIWGRLAWLFVMRIEWAACVVVQILQ